MATPGRTRHLTAFRLERHCGKPSPSRRYAASIAVWNSGNTEIKSDDVRAPFRIVVGGGTAQTIEITPVYYTRDNVDGFNIDSKTGVIEWKHFDAGEGFKLRVIYTNTSMTDIQIRGYAVGAPIISYDELRAKKTEQDSKFNTASFYYVIMLGVLIVILLVTAVTLQVTVGGLRSLLLRQLRGLGAVGWFGMVCAGLLAAVAGALLYQFYLGPPVGPLPNKPF